MYKKIHEPIEVMGVYLGRAFAPRQFKWRQCRYKVDSVTLRTDYFDGSLKKRIYAVAVGVNLYRLLFNRESESWFLEEIWCD